MPRIRSKQIIGEKPTKPEHLATKEYVDDILNNSISSSDKRRLAYFHSLSKVMTNANQNIYENKYKGSHNVIANEIWTSDISFVRTFEEAYAESLINNAVKLYENVKLSPIYGSNGQTYCYIENGEFKDDTYPLIERGKITTGGVFIRPLIGPEDIYDTVTNEISKGYTLILYRGPDATSGANTEIKPDEGEWYVNYYSGTIHFLEGFTPADLGWGSIRATFFQYNGNFIGDDYNIILKSAVFENNKIVFNKNTTSELELDLSTLVLSNVIKNISLNNNKELVLTRSDNSTFKVDLKPLIKDVVNNVTYNNNKLVFYRDNIPFLETDINEILLDYNNAFNDAFIDLLNDELVFTKINGQKHSIQLSQLQDRSAFNYSELKNNLLIFTKQSGDINIVDLNNISLSDLNPDILDYATFNKTTNILSFSKLNGDILNVNLSSLKLEDGATSIISNLNANMSANNTTSENNLACNVPLLSPNILSSNVLVFVNGVQVYVGDNDDCECYFSNDNGVTKKELTNIEIGDKLYWNYVDSLPYAEYNLSPIDKITFNYLNVK